METEIRSLQKCLFVVDLSRLQMAYIETPVATYTQHQDTKNFTSSQDTPHHHWGNTKNSYH
jgi:hypothetical protein